MVEAGGGVFTESHTHEFQVLAESGEDTIYFKEGWEFWKNREIMTDEELNDPSIKSESAIEVGNIFRFGTVYSEKMAVNFTDSDGAKKPAYFGSYGIGLTRLMGVLVEIFHDDRGIIWPENVAPFKVHLVNIGNVEYAQKVYDQLTNAKIEVLWDDRDVSAGEKFADADLIGIPTRLVVSDKLGEGQIEIKSRSEANSKNITFESFLDSLGK